MLTLANLQKVCTDQRGIQFGDIEIHTVFTNEESKVNKGLFVPLFNGEEVHEDLKEAINNGAITALWWKDVSIPKFLPNDFPLFLVEHPLDSLEMVVKEYFDTKDLKGNGGLDTNLIFSISNKHIQKKDSYANAVKEELEKLRDFVHKSCSMTLIIKEGGEYEC
ncbi:hypothetical protein ACFSCX_04005 [Bacillus salitolerans]|uniref:Uncharacterized protein n=1 Tax=Bacillus salitolerans TaxID=1437434 RepID=A0ABW4LKJ2_9BACI